MSFKVVLSQSGQPVAFGPDEPGYAPVVPTGGSLVIQETPPIQPDATPDQIEALRRAAFQAEADPLFFKSQRGEATQAEWLAKVAEIKARFPE